MFIKHRGMIKIRIAYEKEAAKHIQAQDKPTRQSVPLPDEIEAIERVNRSIAENGTIPHEAINWD